MLLLLWGLENFAGPRINDDVSNEKSQTRTLLSSALRDWTKRSWAAENEKDGFWAKALCTHRKNPLYRYPHFSNKVFGCL